MKGARMLAMAAFVLVIGITPSAGFTSGGRTVAIHLWAPVDAASVQHIRH